jgi:hypothetical protein
MSQFIRLILATTRQPKQCRQFARRTPPNSDVILTDLIQRNLETPAQIDAVDPLAIAGQDATLDVV